MVQELVKAVIFIIVSIIYFFVLSDIINWVYDRHYIFISYAEEDKSRAEFAVEVVKKQLKNRLRYSPKVLTAKDILPGSMMTYEKYSCIKRADVCIVFLSSDFMKNSDCNYELSLMNHSTVIPVFLDYNVNSVRYPPNIMCRKGIFLEGCYSHRLIEDKMKLLTKVL